MVTSSRTALCVAFSLAFAAGAAAQVVRPDTVFTWQRSSDRFDLCAQGYQWQQMGFIGTNGRPATESLLTGDLRFGNTVVGTLLFDVTERLVGYRRADGTMEAMDVNAGWTNDEAWLRVANEGLFSPFGHGAERHVTVMGNRVLQTGGGILMDQRALRDGFTNAANGAGTAGGFGPAYRLTARGADDAVRIDVNGCYSSNDPDGVGPITSVTASLGPVIGHGVVRGHIPQVNVIGAFPMTGTSQQRGAAVAALNQAMRDSGFRAGGLNLWLVSLPWDTRFQTIDNALAAANVQGVTVGITYRLGQQPQGVPPVFGDIPELPIPYSSVYLAEPYTGPGISRYNNDERADVDATAWMELTAGDVFGTTLFHLNQLPILPVTPPPLAPYIVSGCFDYRFNHTHVSVAGPVEFGLRIVEGSVLDAQIYYLNGSSWQLVPSIIDGDARIASSMDVGIYAAFSTVPSPAPGALLALAGIAIARRRR